jgi:hypothetical protein
MILAWSCNSNVRDIGQADLIGDVVRASAVVKKLAVGACWGAVNILTA